VTVNKLHSSSSVIGMLDRHLYWLFTDCPYYYLLYVLTVSGSVAFYQLLLNEHQYDDDDDDDDDLFLWLSVECQFSKDYMAWIGLILRLLKTAIEGRVSGKTGLGWPRQGMLSDILDEYGYEKIKRRMGNRWEWEKFVHERSCLRPAVKQNTQRRTTQFT